VLFVHKLAKTGAEGINGAAGAGVLLLEECLQCTPGAFANLVFDQAGYELRCEWGLRGLLTLLPASDAIVVVDVLSFSTAVDVVVGNGAHVLPCRWKDDSAARLAREKNAPLARCSVEGVGEPRARAQQRRRRFT